jgi:hypothetical protein
MAQGVGPEFKPQYHTHTNPTDKYGWELECVLDGIGSALTPNPGISWFSWSQLFEGLSAMLQLPQNERREQMWKRKSGGCSQIWSQALLLYRGGMGKEAHIHYKLGGGTWLIGTSASSYSYERLNFFGCRS